MRKSWNESQTCPQSAGRLQMYVLNRFGCTEVLEQKLKIKSVKCDSPVPSYLFIIHVESEILY